MVPSTATLSSDTLLVCLVPLAVLILSVRLLPSISLHDISEILNPRAKSASYGPFSLQRAFQCFSQYHAFAGAEVKNMRASYAKLGRAHKRLGYAIGYPQKLDRLEGATRVNAKLAGAIAELARQEFEPAVLDVGWTTRRVDIGDLGRARETLKHFVRDWSEEGREERDRIFTPILDVLKEVEEDRRVGMKVLVPGSGLGRLAWEISQLGFDTTACEISFFMNLAFRFLLSPTTTTASGQHSVHPYAHWFSHQRTSDSLFRHISFPDTVPRLSPHFRLAESDFLSLSPPSSPYQPEGYDYIVTLFFIDTAPNIFATLEHIYALLRPGGTWVTLGPLLWLGGAQARAELSLEEVLRVIEAIGFILEPEGGDEKTRRRSVACEYTRDKGAMMRWVYEAEFWVARKSK